VTLRDFISIVRRRWRIIAGLTATVVAIVAVWSILVTPIYQATATLFVSVRGATSEQELFLVQAERVSSYADLASSDRVLSAAGSTLKPTLSAAELRDQVSVVQPPSTVLIDIGVRNSNPTRARDIANAVARKTSALVEQLETRGENTASPIKVSVAEPATTPEAPASPQKVRNILFALVIGLVLGFAGAIVRELLDNRIKDSDSLEEDFQVPVLATVRDHKDLRDHPLVAVNRDLDKEGMSQETFGSLWSISGAIEDYRQLRASLQFFDYEDRGRTIMVTSVKTGEGKSTTAGNLAAALALAGESVVLVDCDLRRPRIAQYMDIDQDHLGLTNVLIGTADLDEVLDSGPKLGILTSGPIPPNPTELLGSAAMSKLLDQLRMRFDAVVLDTPPALAFADASVLAPQVGATVVVVRENYVTRTELERTLNTLSVGRARVSGFVLNMRHARRGLRGYGYGYEYGYGYQSGSAPDTNGARTKGVRSFFSRRRNDGEKTAAGSRGPRDD
jgi:polysaccharide biosynthesis transport protein